MAKKPNGSKRGEAASPNERVVSENRKAFHNYDILDTLECGIVLVGSEVKSLRENRISLEEAHGRVKGNEVWLIGADIPEYRQASAMNHPSRRARKLLLHRREIRKIAGKAVEKGLTLVPLKVYFKDGLAKLLLGVCRGRKLHDKRHILKKAENQRDLQRAMRRR